MGPSSFAQLLRQYRRGLGLTQEELAERARLSARAVSDLERGINQNPRLTTVRLLVEALELAPADAARLRAAAQQPSIEVSTIEHQQGRRHNLPRELTSFVGRERLLADIVRMMSSDSPACPLLRLTGPGGSGKTRLALKAAMTLVERFADGAWFVGLAPISDPGLLVPTSNAKRSLAGTRVSRHERQPELRVRSPIEHRLGRPLRLKD